MGTASCSGGWMLQWGRAFVGAEILRPEQVFGACVRFNGAAPLWARRYRLEMYGRWAGRCFNGAAPLWARR